LDIPEAEAFLIASSISPRLTTQPQSIRLFLDRYRQLDREEAARKVAMWSNGPLRTEARQSNKT
jgi:hypothetical protein